MYCYTCSDIVKVVSIFTFNALDIIIWGVCDVLCPLFLLILLSPALGCLWTSLILLIASLLWNKGYQVAFWTYKFSLITIAQFLRNLINMTKNQPNISSNGEASNQRQGLHIPVILAMNDFLALRFVWWLYFSLLCIPKFVLEGSGLYIFVSTCFFFLTFFSFVNTWTHILNTELILNLISSYFLPSIPTWIIGDFMGKW